MLDFKKIFKLSDKLSGVSTALGMNQIFTTGMAKKLIDAINAQPAVDSRPYKVYTALLNQTLIAATSNTDFLIVGHRYKLTSLDPGDDFSNLGIVEGDVFIFNGTEPTTWLASTVKDLTATTPVPTVLENTLGDVTFILLDSGFIFTISSDGLFTTNKTYYVQGEKSPNQNVIIIQASESLLAVSDTASYNDLGNFPIEIRVYN